VFVVGQSNILYTKTFIGL